MIGWSVLLLVGGLAHFPMMVSGEIENIRTDLVKSHHSPTWMYAAETSWVIAIYNRRSISINHDEFFGALSPTGSTTIMINNYSSSDSFAFLVIILLASCVIISHIMIVHIPKHHYPHYPHCHRWLNINMNLAEHIVV